jgi:hypothetical protein
MHEDRAHRVINRQTCTQKARRAALQTASVRCEQHHVEILFKKQVGLYSLSHCRGPWQEDGLEYCRKLAEGSKFAVIVACKLTVVAAGTSVPELAVSTIAAYQGKLDIAIANVVGSNIFNITVINGLCALVRPVNIVGNMIKLDTSPCTRHAACTHNDGEINRLDASLCLAIYVGFTRRTTPRKINAIVSSTGNSPSYRGLARIATTFGNSTQRQSSLREPTIKADHDASRLPRLTSSRRVAC